MRYGLREPGKTFQIYWLCLYEEKTGGVVGVTIDGANYAGETINAANGYMGVVTGVSGDYQMTLDGVNVSGATGKSPSWPSDGKFDLLVLCDSQPFDNVGSFAKVQALEPNAFMVVTEELYYIDQQEGAGPSIYPLTLTPVYNNHELDAATNQAEYDLWLDQDTGSVGLRQKYINLDKFHPDRQAFFASYPHLSIPDNHQLLHSNMYGNGEAQQPLDGQIGFNAVRQVYNEYLHNGWPQPTGDIDVYPTPLLYGSKEIENLKIIWVDQSSYDPAGNGGNQELDDGNVNVSNVTRQVQWINDELNNTTAEFIVIFFHTPIDPAMGSFVGGDATALAQYIAASNKTVFFVTGDSHQSWARLIYEDNLINNPVLDVGCSPCSPTNASSVYTKLADDVYYLDKVHRGSVLTAPYDPLGGTPLIVTMADTSLFSDTENDNLQRVFFEDLRGSFIDSIDSPTQITLTAPAFGSTLGIGTEVWMHEIHTSAHIASNPNDKNVYYMKISMDGSNPVRLQIIEVYGQNNVIFDRIVFSGRRNPVQLPKNCAAASKYP